jgi:methylmalonyl-CoA/ethylmalonyl-CoA epimerase
MSATDPQGRATSNAHEIGVRFDRVALVVKRPTDLWGMLAESLGGRFAGSGTGQGYGWTDLRFANGFILEGIHPETATSDQEPTAEVVERFLEKYGVGPHHLTFMVTDLEAMLARLSKAGIEAVTENQDDPRWQEAFLRPRDAQGVVIQLVQMVDQPSEILDEPEGFPEIGFDHPVASLGRVVHAVHDLSAALHLFRDLLDGRVLSTGAALDGNHWAELGWGGPGRLRLLEATHAEIADWVGDRPGRVRHLFFNFDEPEYVPGAQKVAAGRWVVDCDEVLGTRLVISSSAR